MPKSRNRSQYISQNVKIYPKVSEINVSSDVVIFSINNKNSGEVGDFAKFLSKTKFTLLFILFMNLMLITFSKHSYVSLAILRPGR